jgi:hypothetical protein
VGRHLPHHTCSAPTAAGPSGITHPEWSAHALDINGNELASAGEALTSSASNVPAQSFTLTGTDIVALRIDSNSQHVAAFSAALLDDFVLTPTAPRTTTWAHVVAAARQRCGQRRRELDAQ